MNVRLVDDDGQVYPVELAYLGRRGGLDRWRATTLVTLPVNRPFELMADELPGRCHIELCVERAPS